MALIRTVVADDSPDARNAVTTILGSDPLIKVLGVAADGIAATRAIEEHHPDVAYLDIRMPGHDGLTIAERARRTSPETAIIVLTTFSDDALVDRALGAGVSGFVLKSSGPDEILAAAHTATGGGIALSRRITERLALRLATRPNHGFDVSEIVASLTVRKRTLLSLIALGCSNAEIAAELHLTEGTVKGYVSTLFDRLGVKNRVQAAVIGATTR